MILKIIFSKRLISILFFGISSGLPLLLIGSTLKAWMKELNVDLGTIGIFAIVGLPYTIKFLWAPVLDRFKLPFLDRRRGWIFISQIILSVLFLLLSFCRPDLNPISVGVVTFLIAFFSATQDIAIDAYRREILPDIELGLGSSFAVNGYRIGMLIAGSGAFLLADRFGWRNTYILMSTIMFLCVIITFLAPFVETPSGSPKTMKEAVINPFIDYFSFKHAIEILAFILLFKMGDQIASDMLSPFYLSIGFNKTQMGIVSFWGFFATLLGMFIGGIIMLKIGITRSLWFFGILQMVSTAFFSLLAHVGPNFFLYAGVVAFENLSSGMGTSTYVAFMASLCNKNFTATQYALLSSLMGVPRVFLGTTSGFLAKLLGWKMYFIFCTLLAIPGLLLLLRAPKWKRTFMN